MKHGKFSILVMVLLVALIFAPVIYSVMVRPTDFQLHIATAQSMSQTGTVTTPHPLYQFLVIGIHAIFGNWILAAFLVTLSFYVFLSLVLYVLNPLESSVLSALTSLALMLVTPVSLIPDGHLYFGYLGITVYHNPTIVILRPLAVLLFLYAVKAFERETKIRDILTAGLLTIISTLAKPNYTICLLPALIIWMGVKKHFNWQLIVIVISGVLVLGWQYYLLRSSPSLVQESSGIVFAPFKVWGSYSSWLFFKFVLSILFPLVVYVTFKEARQSTTLNLAWLTFGIGAGYTYFLAEAGGRMQAGNFGSSAQITLFILFVFSTFFFVSRASNNRAGWICATAFGLHLVSGIIWYFRHLVTFDSSYY